MNLRSRRLAIVTAVLLVAIIVAASALVAAVRASKPEVTTASPGASANLVGSTTLEKVSPLNGQGHLKAGYRVVSSDRGYCWTSSFLNGRLYRCFRGNTIMDPCWKETGRPSVACLLDPWSTNVHRLRLTRRLPATGGYGAPLWGLRLGGTVRVRCLMSTGAVGTVGHHPISYLCRRGWVLLDRPDRSRPLWTILTANGTGLRYDLRGRRPLATAWRAVR